MHLKQLKALTLWPEWIPMFFLPELDKAKPKRVENRNWPHVPVKMVGQWIALHAGKTIGGKPINAHASTRDVYITAGYAGYRSDILNTVLATPNIPTSAICGIAHIDRIQHGDRLDAWSMQDCWQFHFDQVIRLEPIPAKGKQGFWQVGPAELAQINTQLQKMEVHK